MSLPISYVTFPSGKAPFFSLEDAETDQKDTRSIAHI